MSHMGNRAQRAWGMHSRSQSKLTGGENAGLWLAAILPSALFLNPSLHRTVKLCPNGSMKTYWVLFTPLPTFALPRVASRKSIWHIPRDGKRRFPSSIRRGFCAPQRLHSSGHSVTCSCCQAARRPAAAVPHATWHGPESSTSCLPVSALRLMCRLSLSTLSARPSTGFQTPWARQAAGCRLKPAQGASAVLGLAFQVAAQRARPHAWQWEKINSLWMALGHGKEGDKTEQTVNSFLQNGLSQDIVFPRGPSKMSCMTQQTAVLWASQDQAFSSLPWLPL